MIEVLLSQERVLHLLYEKTYTGEEDEMEKAEGEGLVIEPSGEPVGSPEEEPDEGEPEAME